MEEKIITNSERKIRLSQYDRNRLYSVLLAESGIEDRVIECSGNLTKIVEQLFVKYIIPDTLEDCYPGCERLSNGMDIVYIDIKDDFNINFPKFSIEKDLVRTPSTKISIRFSKSYPMVLNERSYCYTSEEGDKRFADSIKKLASNDDLNLLETALIDLVNALLLKATYLKELRTSPTRSWRGICELGKFFNLGALYDYNREWGYIMKYRILGIRDFKEKEKERIEKKDTNDLSPLEHISVLKQILGF
jgi:hypothetical protein